MRRMMKTLMLMLLCLVLCTAAAAAEYTVSGKTISVSGGGNAIQEAIDYIAAQSDKEDWTIQVAGGSYNRFNVLRGVNGLTIEGLGSVEIGVLDGSTLSNKNGVASDYKGIIVNAGDFTLHNVALVAGSVTSPWNASAIAVSNGATSMEHAAGMKIAHVDLRGSGAAYGMFFDNMFNEFMITDCTFSNFAQGIYAENTGGCFTDAEIVGNTFTDCSFTFHGSYAGTGQSAGTLSLTTIP